MAGYRRKERVFGPLFWVIFAVCVLIILLGWFYVMIQQPLWDERKEAAQTILQETNVEKIESIRPFVSDEKYYIAEGTDLNGKSMVVWLHYDDADLHSMYLSENFPRIFVENQLLETFPDAQIIRVIPGVYRDEFAWEVFFKLNEDKGTRRLYAYYRFSDGELLDVYRLAIDP